MTGKMDATPEVLREAAARAQQLGEAIAADKRALDAGLAATNGSWGDDEQGHGFADGERGHLAGQHASDQSLDSNIGGADKLAQALRESADKIEGRDQGSARSLDM